MGEHPGARRLLVLLPFPPRLDGVHGGSRATAQLLAGLAERQRIALICLRARGEPGVDARVASGCEVVEEVTRPGGPDPLPLRFMHGAKTARGLAQGLPLWAAARRVPALGRRVRAFVADWEPGIVQIEYTLMGQYLPALARCPAPRVLTVHEPAAAAAWEKQAHARGIRRVLLGADARRWERFERGVLGNVDTAVVFTPRDAGLVGRLGARDVVRIPLGMPLPPEPLDPLGAEPPTLLFVGNFIHPPNVDAGVHLIRDIFPPLRARFPTLTLWIVGDGPTPEMAAAAGQGVNVTGRVDRVEPYLNRATVVVAPLRTGGGMRVKTLEALAAGKALVASPLAVEGLDVTDGEHVLVAEREEDFRAAVAALLNDPRLRERIAIAARRWAEANLAPGGSVAAYEALYERLLGAAPSPPESPAGAPL